MPIPTSAGMSTVHHVKYTDENGNVWVETPKGKHLAENQEFYVGYNSNTGFNANINGIGISQSGISYTGGQRAQTVKKGGYSRSVAATAKDISQGGMTKEEVQQWNIAHPNETAWRNE